MGTDELVQLLDRTGALSLSIGAYSDAAALLRHADAVDTRGDHRASGERLCRLASALDGLGRVDEARSHLARTVSLGSLVGDPALTARAAVQYALPVDWYAGDDRAAGFLASALEQPLERADRVAVTAARALVDMRLPLWETNGQQVAWITRPNVAQPLAEQALAQSEGLNDEARLLALLAWRGTHRGPDHLARRRHISDEAFTLAQRLRHPSFQVDAGVWRAVDAVESGDRAAYDRCIGLVRWIAEQDGNPRLRWRALTLAAGQAMLDGDPGAAEAARRDAGRLADVAQLPGAAASEAFILGQRFISDDDLDGLAVMTKLGGEPIMQNPIALAGVAYAHARVGDPGVARSMVVRSLQRLDAESSQLLATTRLAATAVLLDDDELVRRLIAMLLPYREHASVDSNGWWIDGPVDAWLALLYRASGNRSATLAHARSALRWAQSFGDQRTVRRLAHLSVSPASSARGRELTTRETQVLRLVRQGLTNSQIADAMSFSVSTIRQTLAVLYDYFGTRNRAGLMAAASDELMAP